MKTPQDPEAAETVQTTDSPAVVQERLVLPFFRVILTRLAGRDEWHVVSNPRWDHCTRGQSAILDNTCNDYAEYRNCGCVYRMIRYKDRREYGIRKLRSVWTLDPRQNAQGDSQSPAKRS